MRFLFQLLRLSSVLYINLLAWFHKLRYSYKVYATYRGAKILVATTQEVKFFGFDVGGYLAYTIGEYIFVRDPSVVTNNVILHEYRHVEQWRYYGALFRIFNYRLEHNRKGYTRNKFEREAELAESGNLFKLIRRKNLSKKHLST